MNIILELLALYIGFLVAQIVLEVSIALLIIALRPIKAYMDFGFYVTEAMIKAFENKFGRSKKS